MLLYVLYLRLICVSIGANVIKSNRWIAYDLSSHAFKLAKYASEELDASSSMMHIKQFKGSDRRVKKQLQQPLEPDVRLSGLANVAAAPKKAVGDTRMIGGLEDVVAVDDSPVKSEDRNTVSWLGAGIGKNIKDSSKDGHHQRLESKPLESGRVDIYGDGLNDLTTN